MAFIPSTASFQRITISQPNQVIRLSYPFFAFTGSINITDIIEFTDTVQGGRVVMPNAQQTSLGQNYLFFNKATEGFVIFPQDGDVEDDATSIGTLPGNSSAFIVLTRIRGTDSDGNAVGDRWEFISLSEEGNRTGIHSLRADGIDSAVGLDGTFTGLANIKIDNETGPNARVNLDINSSLNTLATLDDAAQGFLVREVVRDPDNNNITGYSWHTREIRGGMGLTTGGTGTGVQGDAVVNLNNTINNIAIGNYRFDSGIITGQGDSSLVINTVGNNNLVLNGITISSQGEIIGGLSGLVPIAWCIFRDDGTGSENASTKIPLIGGVNISEIEREFDRVTRTLYKFTFTANLLDSLSEDNYGVVVSVGSRLENERYPVHIGSVTSRGKDSFDVVIASPDGVATLPRNLPVTVLVFNNRT